MEQYTSINCIAVQGVPENNWESVLEVVKNIGEAINIPVTEAMFDNCHHLGRCERDPGWHHC